MKARELGRRVRALEHDQGLDTNLPDIRERLARSQWSRRDALEYLLGLERESAAASGHEPNPTNVVRLLHLIDTTTPSMLLIESTRRRFVSDSNTGLALDFSTWTQSEIRLFAKMEEAHLPDDSVQLCLTPAEVAFVESTDFIEKLDRLMGRAESIWARDSDLLAAIVSGPDLGGHA